MSEETNQTVNGGLVPTATKELDYRDREHQSYFRGVSPSDPINKMMGVAVALKDAVFITDAAKGNASSVFFLLSMAQEMGLAWTHGLRSIYLTKAGKPGLQGDVVLALLLSKGFKVKFTKSTKQEASVWIKRPGEDGMEFEDSFTIEDAETARLTCKDNWKMYAKDLLRWRALMRTARIVAADVIGGIYLPEELESIDSPYPQSARESAETEAERKAEEDPAFAITPKGKPATEPAKAQVIDLPPAESRMEAFLKEQERKKEKTEKPVCEICGASECEHMPDPNAKPAKRETKEEKTAPAPNGTKAEREALKTRILSMAKGIEDATPKMVSAFVVGYYSEHPEDAKDLKKVSAALDALEAKLKDSPKDSVALTVDADAFGKYLRQHGAEQLAQSDSQFPGWSEETVKIAHACMTARNFDDKRFSTVLKSFGIDKMPEAEAQAALKLYLPTPDGFLLVRRAKANRDLDALGALEMVEKELGHPIATVAHSEVVKAITNALSEVTA